MRFRVWLEANEEIKWPVPWPFRKGTGDGPRERDTPPQVTPTGDYVVYHSTNIENTRLIFKERTVRHDDMHKVGITTTASAAGVYAAMKIKKPNNPGVVLRLVIDKGWLMSQQITRETGGSGYDQWLIDTPAIPPEAIKELDLYSVYGTPIGRFGREQGTDNI